MGQEHSSSSGCPMGNTHNYGAASAASPKQGVLLSSPSSPSRHHTAHGSKHSSPVNIRRSPFSSPKSGAGSWDNVGIPGSDASTSLGDSDDLVLSVENLPEDALVEHFLPPTFPIDPVITSSTLRLCRESWEKIKTLERNGTSGLVWFFDEFYTRLFDRAESFRVVFNGDLKMKGIVLVMALEFMTTLDVSNLTVAQLRLKGLGESHNAKADIRPWMYSVYAETALTVIAHAMGNEATFSLMHAWTNLFAFVLRQMLPPAIKNKIVVSESTQNVFTNRVDADQAANAAANYSSNAEGQGHTTKRYTGDYHSKVPSSRVANARNGGLTERILGGTNAPSANVGITGAPETTEGTPIAGANENNKTVDTGTPAPTTAT